MGKVRLRKQIRAEVEQNAFLVQIARRPYACVVAFAWRDGMLWSDAGFSKAKPVDQDYDEEKGVRIARGRALDGIVRQITGEKKREERILTAEDLYQVAKLRILENSQRGLETALGVEPEAIGPSPMAGIMAEMETAGSSPLETLTVPQPWRGRTWEGAMEETVPVNPGSHQAIDAVGSTAGLGPNGIFIGGPHDAPHADPKVAPWLADAGPPASGRQDSGPAWTDTGTAPWLPPAGQSAQSLGEAPLDR